MIHYNRHLYSDKGPNVSKGEVKKREEKMGRLAECMFLRLARDCGGVAANGLHRCLRRADARRVRGCLGELQQREVRGGRRRKPGGGGPTLGSEAEEAALLVVVIVVVWWPL